MLLPYVFVVPISFRCSCDIDSAVRHKPAKVKAIEVYSMTTYSYDQRIMQQNKDNSMGKKNSIVLY
jgi:hypothetical protein